MAPMLIPRVMDEMNDDDEDPSKDVEPRTKQPKLSDEEEMAPASSGGGLSCAAVTQAETTDSESSATFSAYEYDQYFFDRSCVNDDSVELFYQQEAIRRLNFAKKLCTMDSVNFYRSWEDLYKEFEMEGVITPKDGGVEDCLIVRCDKFCAVHRSDMYYNLLERKMRLIKDLNGLRRRVILHLSAIFIFLRRRYIWPFGISMRYVFTWSGGTIL